jgi:hypothetical protein
MKLGNEPWRALKPDAQAFDEVRIITVPRYKQSGLSGNEWRISASIQLWRKGKMIVERGARDIEAACMFVGAFYLDSCDNGLAFFGGEDDICDQEGCSQSATVTYRLKAQYCREGHRTEPHQLTIRKFCDRHKTRGDGALEDADDNYEVVK